MKMIGLIGGMSWESTATYYRLINEGVRDAFGGLASAPLLLHSVDFQSIVALQQADQWQEAAMILGQAGRGLAHAGADRLLICTNTMHKVAREVEMMAGVPTIDIITETAHAIREAGFQRPLLLGTRYTMEHGFYAARMADEGLDLMVPADADDRARVHDIIFGELCQGIVTDRARADYLAIIKRAAEAGADAVILGCTEIGLLLDANRLPLPGFDSTHIHAAAAVRYVTSEGLKRKAA